MTFAKTLAVLAVLLAVAAAATQAEGTLAHRWEPCMPVCIMMLVWEMGILPPEPRAGGS